MRGRRSAPYWFKVRLVWCHLKPLQIRELVTEASRTLQPFDSEWVPDNAKKPPLSQVSPPQVFVELVSVDAVDPGTAGAAISPCSRIDSSPACAQLAPHRAPRLQGADFNGSFASRFCRFCQGKERIGQMSGSDGKKREYEIPVHPKQTKLHTQLAPRL